MHVMYVILYSCMYVILYLCMYIFVEGIFVCMLELNACLPDIIEYVNDDKEEDDQQRHPAWHNLYTIYFDSTVHVYLLVPF